MEKCNKAPRCVTAAVSPTKELIKTQSNKGHPLIVKKASVSSPGWHRPVKTTRLAICVYKRVGKMPLLPLSSC